MRVGDVEEDEERGAEGQRPAAHRGQSLNLCVVGEERPEAMAEGEDGRGGGYRIELVGAINKCGVIKPRHSVKWADFDKWESRYLPEPLPLSKCLVIRPFCNTPHKYDRSQFAPSFPEMEVFLNEPFGP